MYRPTPQAKRRARRLAVRLTPRAKVHDDYTEAAKLFLGVVDLLPFVEHGRRTLRLETLRWHRSVLFKREYLLAHVDDALLGEVAPECDAIATATSSIPLVLVPLRRRRSRSELFTSILEHEFVHVNQMLLGLFGRERLCGSVSDAVARFSEETAVEHDANFIQLATWPRLFPRELGISLEHWCVLRGWTAALELAVIGAYCTPKLLGRFLTELREAARSVVRGLGASATVASWIEENHVGLVRSAIELHVRRMAAPGESAALRTTAAWVNRAQQS